MLAASGPGAAGGFQPGGKMPAATLRLLAG